MAWTPATPFADDPGGGTPLDAAYINAALADVANYADTINGVTAQTVTADAGSVNAAKVTAPSRTGYRVPKADKAFHDLRDFYSGSSQPADVLSYIHDGLAKSETDGGVLLIPDSEEPWVVTGPIVPPINSRMMAAFPFPHFNQRISANGHGTEQYQLPANPNGIGEAWIKLANGSNCPILANDYLNTAGKRGPAYGGGYFQWFTAAGITFDHNGRNQTGSTLRAVDIRDAWAMNFPYCRVVAPRGNGFYFSNTNECNGAHATAGGDTENVANGTGNLASSFTISTASGTWAKGDMIAGTGIPSGAYLTAVSGTTLTLSAAATVTATGAALSKVTPLADTLLTLQDSTDAQWPHISMHNAKSAVVTIDSSYGVRVSGLAGYCIGGYNLRLSDSLATGTYQNHIDLRLEQSTKHNCRIDTGCYDNTVDVNAYTPGLFSPAADADGGWANVFCDGKNNTLRGNGSMRVGQDSSISAMVRYGGSAQKNLGQMAGGSDMLPTGTPLYAFNGSISSSLTRSNSTPIPPAQFIPHTAFRAADGTTPTADVAFNSSTHKVMTFANSVDSSAVAYVTMPEGSRTFKFQVVLVNMNAANSGNVRVQLGFDDILYTGGETLGVDEQTLGPSTVAVAASLVSVNASFSGASVTVPQGQVVALRFKRVGTNVADTLANALGFVGVRIEPQLLSG